MIFCFDLDQTLIYTQKHLMEGWPVVPAEYRQGEPFSFMTPGALSLLRTIQTRAICLANTLRGPEQANRVTFVEDGSCRYTALQNGLYLYRDGIPDMEWAAHVAATIRDLPLGLDDGVSRVLGTLPGIQCLAKQYQYLAVFFVDESFDDVLCAALATELALLGWLLVRQRKKLYLLPLAIHKGSALERVRQWENGAEAVGFGDSGFDLPFLALCRAAWAPRGSELDDQTTPVALRLSQHPAQGATEEILSQILEFLQSASDGGN